MTTETKKTVQISKPKFQTAVFEIKGVAPLVVHRFSAKTKEEMRLKAEAGKTASSRKVRTAQDSDAKYNESRYIAKAGWDGINASAFRAAMISACRLVGFKMTLAKLSIFILQDGWDATEPQVPLVRIYGKPTRQDDMARTEVGTPYVTIRAAYYDWAAKVKIRWDADQFTTDDIFNLLYRVGAQVGLCEGRPDSKHSVGMGWGLFEVQGEEEGHA